MKSAYFFFFCFFCYVACENMKLALILPVQRSVETRVICDGEAYERYVDECRHENGVDTAHTASYSDYYSKLCIEQGKAIFCKPTKGVVYTSNGEETNFVPCDSAIHKNDIELCK